MNDILGKMILLCKGEIHEAIHILKFSLFLYDFFFGQVTCFLLRLRFTSHFCFVLFLFVKLSQFYVLVLCFGFVSSLKARKEEC